MHCPLPLNTSCAPHSQPLLCLLPCAASCCRRLGTTKSALRVYDPYFCEGRMVQHMAQLGFESVYNK
jgi:hypothetical protein